MLLILAAAPGFYLSSDAEPAATSTPQLQSVRASALPQRTTFLLRHEEGRVYFRVQPHPDFQLLPPWVWIGQALARLGLEIRLRDETGYGEYLSGEEGKS